MNSALLFETEPLLLPAILLAATGLALVLHLVRRTAALAREEAPLRRARIRAAAEAASLPFGEARCRAILDALPDPVAVQDGQGTAVYANLRYRELEARFAATAGKPRPGRRGVPAGERGPFGFDWAEAIVGQDGWTGRLLSGRRPRDDGGAERGLEDARRRAEAASEAKSRLLADVSHEFRTPLNGILGLSGLLLETALDAEQRTYVTAVKSSAEGFLVLVEQILDHARLEAGRTELAHEPFGPEALVGSVVELLSPRAQGKGIEIASFVSREVPRLVSGDADRLRQVLLNLAGNAVKFTEAGGVGIRVEAEAGGVLVFSVEDTGPGIPAERHGSVFEPFDRGGVADRVADGTGLGLAITRDLVERLGGTIALDSAKGAGSRFQVRLDLPAAAEPAASPEPVPPPAGSSVLILASSPFQAPYLRRMLAEIGLDAEVVPTLAEAASRLRRRRYDVVIADGGRGEDVRALAEEAERSGVGRRIVLLSPFERRSLGSPLVAGFDAFLIKPVRRRSLLEQVAGGARPPAPPEGRPGGPGLPGGRAPRVLLAEDNEVNALVAMRALQKLGVVADWAKDGPEALDKAEAALGKGALPFDLILMDVRMPGLDGREVTRRLRRRAADATARAVPRIVALTASVVGQPDDGMDGLFDAVLGKPFGLEALAEQVALARSAPAMAG